MRELKVNEIKEVNGGVYAAAILIARGAIALGPKIQSGLQSLGDSLGSLYSNLNPQQSQK